MTGSIRAIRHVLIYQGHQMGKLLGPYSENIAKRVKMFERLEPYRTRLGHTPWTVTTVWGEQLIPTIKRIDPSETLLVIPAGQSTHLDKVFSATQARFLQDEFFMEGGRGYLNCGSAYWVSRRRIYHDICLEQPEQRKPIIKTTQLPLFEGVSEGPLCPYPGKKYNVGFFSDAVDVQAQEHDCTVFLSGGGYFVPDPDTKQPVRVLAEYAPHDLERLGIPEAEQERKRRAVIMVGIGKGAALLSMFHPYYGPQDIDTERYETAFPDCGTDWKRVHARLSPVDVRMRFVYHSLLRPLEELKF